MASRNGRAAETGVRLVDVDRAGSDALPCCGIKNPAHPGRVAKCGWLQANARFGVRAKALLAADGRAIGYIEYVPGERAWRGVSAAGYMVIHCVWNHSKAFQRRGCGRAMIDACCEDAKRDGLSGVAVVTRRAPWIADDRLFLANGFETVDTAPPDYRLLARSFDDAAARPRFKDGWDRKAARHGVGLTIIRSSQCPYVTKFSNEIAQTAEEEYGMTPRIVDLESWRDAQNAPTPYAVFAVIHNGRVIADHQISRARFRNIMRSEGVQPRRG
jgi:hypothetical protein